MWRLLEEADEPFVLPFRPSSVSSRALCGQRRSRLSEEGTHVLSLTRSDVLAKDIAQNWIPLERVGERVINYFENYHDEKKISP